MLMINLTFISVHPDFFPGTPVKKALTMVVVTNRDNRAPRSTSPVYNRSLVENIGVNKLYTTVIAIDRDGDDITYSIMVCYILYLLLRLNTGIFR